MPVMLIFSAGALAKAAGITGGAVVTGAGLGGGTGGAGYLRGWSNGNHSFSTTRFVGNTFSGALTGAAFGGMGALAGGGMSVGNNVWRFNNASFNFGANASWRQ